MRLMSSPGKRKAKAMLKSMLDDILFSLPKAAREKMTVEEFHNTHAKALVKDKIQEFFISVSKEKKKLDRYKKQLGFCVHVNCLNFSGRERMCNGCRKALKSAKGKYRRSEYGNIRAAERKNER